MAVSTGQSGADCLEGSDSHILTVDKHLIPFTGADRYNYNFIISDKPKGGTYQIHIKIDPSQVHHTNDVDVNRAERY